MTPPELRAELRKVLEYLPDMDELKPSLTPEDVAIAHVAALVSISDALRDISSKL